MGVYLLDRRDFDKLRESPTRIARLLRDRAEGMLDAGRPAMYDK